MCDALWGDLYGDKGYPSKNLQEKLAEEGINLVTNKRKNMKPRMLKHWDRLMLRKRFIIETVI